MRKLSFIFPIYIIYLGLMLLLSNNLFAQSVKYYLLELNNKDTYSFSINRPQQYLSEQAIARRSKFNIPIDFTDLPIAVSKLKLINDTSVHIVGSSKWLNALLVSTTQPLNIKLWKHINGIKNVVYLGERTFVKKDKFANINELISALEAKVEPALGVKPDSGFYGKFLNQQMMLNTHRLHQMQLTGNGIKIAIFDAGFKNINTTPFFNRLFSNNQVLLTKDFVEPQTGVYDDDSHGAAVLSCMAAYYPTKAVGSSFDASFLLLRTEDAENELLLEEVFWVMAAEFADSAGIDIIQSSLGYNEFDDKKLNHRPKDLNGQSSIISKGAKLATTKGIVVVNSSGNEGDKYWHKIVVPADVEEVITIGGVDANKSLAVFSSVGPTSDKRIKPDLAALAEKVYIVSGDGVLYPGSGTSYASPTVAGVVACLLQAAPSKTNKQIADALRLSASNYFNPDNQIGYGIPDALLALKILGGDTSYQLNSNQLLDIRVLADQRIHVCLNAKSTDKMVVSIIDSTGKAILSEKIKTNKKGLVRLPIKHSNNLNPGMYLLQATFKDETQSIAIIKE